MPGDKIVSLSWSPVTTLQDGSPVRDLAGYLIYRLSGAGDLDSRHARARAAE